MRSASRAPRLASSTATCRGASHAVNEDNFGDVPRDGLFVVADGVGGYTDGDLASRAVCGAVGELLHPEDDITTRVNLIEEALQGINGALFREGREREAPTIIASTVAALVVADQLAACVWAGDSRIYLHRDEHLYRLTDDHNLQTDLGTLGAAGGQLTRAVGSAATLELARRVIEAREGDTFLLCSDGVTKVLSDEDLGHMLADPIEGLAPRLIGMVAERGSSDDATAIVVRYHGDV